jgi:hypothetical protein
VPEVSRGGAVVSVSAFSVLGPFPNAGNRWFQLIWRSLCPLAVPNISAIDGTQHRLVRSRPRLQQVFAVSIPCVT